jgi:DNA-binding transcriptional ArsR family regulator
MNMQDLINRSTDVAELLKAMANSHRLLILCALSDGERSVSELENVVKISQSALSQHLARLRELAIVKTRREAQTIFYSLADDRVRRLMSTLQQEFCVPQGRTARSGKR